jgi:acyl dehydratase
MTNDAIVGLPMGALTKAAERKLLYLEDLEAGQAFGSGTSRLTAGEIKAFARQFDPQPFHLNDEAALGSFFRGLAASGWHTAALTMCLLVEGALPIAGGIIGAGIDELRWPRSVRPGDALHIASEILEVRPSKSRPEQGLVKVRTPTLNQHGETVQSFIASLIVPRRPRKETP